MPSVCGCTEIHALSKHGDELVANLNCDLENVRKWMLQNRLQIHPTKTKYMYTGSSYNILKAKCQVINPILINNIPVPRTGTYTYLGVSLDEKLTWENILIRFGLRLGHRNWGCEANEAFCTSRDIKANLRNPCVTIFQLLQSPLGPLWNWSQRQASKVPKLRCESDNWIHL